MTHFSDILEGDDIYFRDRWQFEQKYDFLPDPELATNEYTQDFYFFIPNALQINRNTYTIEQFYKDQTNLIRSKTPVFSLKEIVDLNNSSSPLARINGLKDEEQNTVTQSLIEKEVKLLGNVVRSAIRTNAQELSSLLEQELYDEFIKGCHEMCDELEEYQNTFEGIKKETADKWDTPSIHKHFEYMTTFLNHVVNQYLILLLERIRYSDDQKFQEIDARITEMLKTTQKMITDKDLSDKREGEKIIYRKSLLNKFFVYALLLNTDRFSPGQRYQNLTGAIAAGIAMLVFFTLFVWQGQFFLINSTPFIVITVFLYILKDRIKEGIKTFTHHRTLGWFSDYTTKIMSPDDKSVLGVLTEKFSYISEDEIPEEISTIRSREFDSMMEDYKLPETVMYYTKKMKINQKPRELEARRFMLNVIFRFNIRHFMDKASNPYSPYLWLNEEAGEIKVWHLPKVYHLNIIVRTTTKQPGKKPKKELSKVRIVADKSGIKRIEYP
jgi:hypothetical protein